MNVADQVIVLDAQGHIVSQGPPTAVPDDVVQLLSTGQQQTSQKDEQISPAAADAFTSKAAQARQIGDFSVYKYYFQSFGWLSATIFIGSVVFNSGFATLQCTCTPACCQLIGSVLLLTCCSLVVWLKWWSEDESDSSNGYWLGIYALLCMLKVVTLVTAI
mgnify:CR=1 FL=1